MSDESINKLKKAEYSVRKLRLCAGQSWYLGVDMQLYWLSPLILLPIWRWPRCRKYYLSLLLLVSVAIQFAVAYVERIRMPFTISRDLEEYKRVTQLMYVPTHTRASPYLIGIMLGTYLQDLKKQQKTLKLSKLKVLLGWLLSTTLCLSVLLGNHPFFASEATHPYDRLASSFYISLHRVAWGAGISWVIAACIFGYGGFANTILSWKVFIPLGRLTYCLFICHLAIQQYQLGTARTNSYFQNFDLVHRYFGDLVVSIAASAILSLLFESPIQVLEKLILTDSKKPKSSPTGAVNKGFEQDQHDTEAHRF